MRILYYDGEGIEHGDFNLQREIMLRHLFDSILANFAAPDQVLWATKTARQTEELRPFRHTGVLERTGADEVTVYGGLWLRMDYSTALSADGPTALVGHKDTKEVFGSIPAASSGNFRRDIIQARLTSVDDATTNRDFKDAVTGALSSSAIVKRSRMVVEYQRKAGVEQASEALADDPTNEQTPDAGWTKIHSFLVTDTGVDTDGGLTANFDFHWDWRKPWGYRIAYTFPEDINITGNGNLSYVGIGKRSISWAAGTRAHWNCGLHDKGMHAYDTHSCNYRIELAVLDSDLDVVPNQDSDFAILSAFFGTDAISGFPWEEFGTGLSTGRLKQTIVDANAGTQKPLWANGRTNPSTRVATFGGDTYGHRLRVEFFGETNDAIYGMQWAAWGGA